MINAGAMMVSSLIDINKEPSERFETVKNYYNKSILTIHDLRFLYWQFSGYKKFFN